jgi:hypothetical protein
VEIKRQIIHALRDAAYTAWLPSNWSL